MPMTDTTPLLPSETAKEYLLRVATSVRERQNMMVGCSFGFTQQVADANHTSIVKAIHSLTEELAGYVVRGEPVPYSVLIPGCDCPTCVRLKAEFG